MLCTISMFIIALCGFYCLRVAQYSSCIICCDCYGKMEIDCNKLKYNVASLTFIFSTYLVRE